MVRTLPSAPRRALLRFALARLAEQGARGRVSNGALLLIFLGWGNVFYTAGFFYLRRVAQATLRGEGPVLECGSGATTLVIATLAPLGARQVQVLEHDLHWHGYLSRCLELFALPGVELVHAPLKSFGEFSWYGTASNFRFAAPIGLVVCDGPPTKTTAGGRYGLLPLVQQHLHSQCTVLLDDTHRRSERRVLTLWQALARFRRRRLHGLVGASTELTFY